ncbi:MAG: PAS domain S-box protein [Gallionella sp.]|nr:PAS domain S-box protein [Gallionella sp.]
MPYPDTRHRLIDMLKQFGIAALYASLIYIEHLYFESDAVMGSFEPASGLALAVLLLCGKRYVGSVFLGALLANAMQHPFMEAAAISSGDTLQAFCGAWLLTRNAGFDRAIHSLNDYLRLLFLGGCVSVGIGALTAVSALLVSGFVTPETSSRELLGWWMGDMLGVILIAPLILVCWQTRNDWRGAKRIAEAALLLGLTFLVGQTVFLGWFHVALGLSDYVVKGYWVFLCVVWVAVRLGTRGTVIAINMAAVQGLLGAQHGVGYFANGTAGAQLDYWLYTLTLSVVGMALATYISGQKRSEEALRRSETKFRALYDATPDAVHLLDEEGRIVGCNRASLDMIGCATKKELFTKSPADLTPPEQPCGTNSSILAYRHIATALEKGSHRFDWVCKRLDNGKQFHVETLLTAMMLDGKQVIQVICRDITERKAADDALRQSELKFRTLFESTNDAVMLMDEKGFLDCNRATLEMIGCATKEEFCSKHPADLSPPQQPCGTSSFILANRHIAAALSEGGRRFEWVSKRADNGRIFTADVLLSAMELEGRLVLQVVIRDITGHKQSEERLRQSKERLRAYLDNISDTIWVIGANMDMVYVSSGVTRLLGVLPEELIGQPSAQVIHPDDMVIIGDAMQYVMGHPGEPKTVQYRVRHKDGRWIPVESTGINLLDNPAINGVLVAMRDITERRLAEKALLESKNQLQATLDAIPDLLFEIGPDGRYLDCHASHPELLAAPAEVLVGKTVHDALPPDAAGVVMSALCEASEKGSSFGRQIELPLPQGASWFELSVAKKLTLAGQEPRFIVLSRDITERKAAEQRLRDLSVHMLEVREEEKARIAREIHDELGGTLAALKMDAYWLSRKLPANDETAPHIERIGSMSQRIDSAVSTMRRVITDLRPSILDDLGMLPALEWQAEEFHKRTGIECRVNCIEDEANLDKHRSIALFRILQETLTNVSRHSGASKVGIKFHHGTNEVILIISDNGCGIPENNLATSKSYGMLGMTERVEQLGGKIIFNSPQEGGFIVAVTLPLPAGKESIQ